MMTTLLLITGTLNQGIIKANAKANWLAVTGKQSVRFSFHFVCSACPVVGFLTKVGDGCTGGRILLRGLH